MFFFSCFYYYFRQSRFSITQPHSCRVILIFLLSRKISFYTSPRLTAWKAYGYSTDSEETNTPLYNIIWQDGLPYFFLIFIMNLVNVILIATVPKTLRAVNLTLG